MRWITNGQVENFSLTYQDVLQLFSQVAFILFIYFLLIPYD